MKDVSVTELRNRLPVYLGRVKTGEEILVTSRGKVIARLSPAMDERQEARKQLEALRSKCRIGDVLSPLDETWEADRGCS